MERKTFKGGLISVAHDVAEWLGCDVGFIYQSYERDGDFSKPRYFELYQQKHATVIAERGK